MEVSSSDPRGAEWRWRFPRQGGDVRAPCHANESFQEARGGCGESADSTGTFRRVTTAKSAAVTSRGLLKRSLRHAASPPQSASQGSNVAVRRGMNEPLPAARGGQDGRAGGSGADFRKSWIGHQGEPWKFHPAIRGGAKRRRRLPRQGGDVRAPCHANGSFRWVRGKRAESASIISAGTSGNVGAGGNIPGSDGSFVKLSEWRRKSAPIRRAERRCPRAAGQEREPL